MNQDDVQPAKPPADAVAPLSDQEIAAFKDEYRWNDRVQRLLGMLDARDAALAQATTRAERRWALLKGAMQAWRSARDSTTALTLQFNSERQRSARLLRLVWLHHGHQMLYGDDGEMQCGICVLDFKRAPLERIEHVLAQQAPAAATTDDGA